MVKMHYMFKQVPETVLRIGYVYTLPYDKRLKMAKFEGAKSLGQLVLSLDQLEPGDGGGEGVLAAPTHQHQGVSCHTQQPQQRRHLP